MPRSVEPVAAYRDEVLNDFRFPSATCVEGADFLLEELESTDPDLDDRCGLLDGRFEVYAIPVPNCARLALAVSLDTKARTPWPCVVHGLVSRRSTPCAAARQRAQRHLDLIDPGWEPADD